MFKPGPSKTGVLVYWTSPPTARWDLDCARVEELCALEYLSGKACDQKCTVK
jgi:hypothetical protein